MTITKTMKWVAALGVAAVLVGCSNSEDEGDPNRIHVGSTSSSLTFAPLTNAIALDSFKAHGLTVEHTDFAASSPNALAALTGGDIQIAVVGASNIFDALQAGADLAVIGGATKMASEMAMNSDVAAERKVSRQTPIAERVEALRGLTIHTTAPGGSTSQTLRVILELYGLDPDRDVTIVPSEPTRIIAGLKDGSVSAAFWATGTMDNNYLDGSAIQYISLPLGDVPDLTENLFVMHVTTQEFLNKRPAAIAAYMDAIRDAGAQTGKEPLAVLKQKYFPDAKPEIFASSWKNVEAAWIRDGSLPESQWNASVALQTELTGKKYDKLDYAKNVRIPAKGTQ